ncbi:hypothetical protein TNCV_4172521 [Trichonephila clavipes]|nr:hypothetical protein TNCV_4172521 [Trichonephila clavipes]
MAKQKFVHVNEILRDLRYRHGSYSSNEAHLNPPAAAHSNPPAAHSNAPAPAHSYPPTAAHSYPPAASRSCPPAASRSCPPAASRSYPPAASRSYPPAAAHSHPPAAAHSHPPAAAHSHPPAAAQSNPPAAHPPAAAQNAPPFKCTCSFKCTSHSNAPVGSHSNAPVGSHSNAPVGSHSNAPVGSHSNPSDEANLSDPDTDFLSNIGEFVHKMRWMILNYSILPLNTVINGPTIRKSFSFDNICLLRIDFQKKDDELHLLLRSESRFYFSIQTKLTLCDAKRKKLHEEDFGPSYIFGKDETQRFIIPIFSGLRNGLDNLSEDTLLIYLSVKFRVITTAFVY